MVIDFSQIGTICEPPTLVLCSADGKAFQTLGYAYSLEADIHYNEVSTISFEIPAYVDGIKTPHYDDIVGMRIIDMLGWGRFILINPSVTNDGVKEVKSCKAYSLEYELTYKKAFFEEATYNFWNPLSPDNTVLGMIMKDLPSWTVGTVDDDLIGKYRTFSEEDNNIYNFMKSTLQKTYGCIFDFDTYSRTVNVRSTAKEATVRPVYLSMDNLIKEIEIEEDTESIVTVLDVNGGENVNIRTVNPLGTNKIYNLDYFLNTAHFSKNIINKWNIWKQTFESHRLTYYNISIERSLKTAAILTEKAVLADMKNIKLEGLESERAVYVEYLAQQTSDADDYDDFQDKLDNVNDRISNMKAEIEKQEDLILNLETEEAELTKRLTDIRDAVSFDKIFSSDELLVLDRYFKEDSIEESTFVVSEVDSYTSSDINNSLSDIKLYFSGCDISEINTDTEKIMYSAKGGLFKIESSDGEVLLTADIVNSCMEKGVDGEAVFSLYLSKGQIGKVSFPGGTVSLTGVTSLFTKSKTDSIECTLVSGNLYFTRNTTDYEKHAVALDLYEYGKETLKSLAYPSYTFDVSAANFMSIDEFLSFTSYLELGQKIYLNTDEEVLQPIFIGFKAEFDDLSSLSLEFGDKYSASDNSFKIVELLDQSISMGKSVNSNKMSYSSFVDSGASTKVKEFMNSALDVAKNSILSSSGQGVAWDNTGLHLRKYINPNNSSLGFEDEEIWMINNSIVFTDDGWRTAKMAIGKIIDENIAKYPETSDTVFSENKTYYFLDEKGNYEVWQGTAEDWADRPALFEKNATAYGIVAPYIVGTMLAGSNLVITTEDGAFRVDSSGVHIDSMKFFISQDNSEYDTTLGGELGKITKINDTLGKVITEDGYLTAGRLQGVIDTSLSTMQNGAGNVLFDEKGIWLMNTATKETATTAIWMNETGILFGTGGKGHIDDDGDNAWKWTTAIGHDGIIADAIATKTLSAFTIKGGSIDIGDGKFCVNSGGELTAESGTFSGTLKATTLDGSLIGRKDGDNDSWLIGCGISVGDDADEDSGNFYVDTDGNVTMKGNINLSGGKITWSSDNTPVQAQYSIDGTSWHTAFQSTDYYVRYSYDGGKTWTDAILARGEKGEKGDTGSRGPRGYDGADGSDAEVTFQKVNEVLGNLYADYSGGKVTTVDKAYIYSPQVSGGDFYGSAFYSGTGSGFTRMTASGLNIFNSDGTMKLGLGCYNNKWSYPYLSLGMGTGDSANGSGIVMKLGNGVWIGDSSILAAGGNYPGGKNSVTDISGTHSNATGIFIDFEGDKIYRYYEGVPSEIGSGTATFG